MFILVTVVIVSSIFYDSKKSCQIIRPFLFRGTPAIWVMAQGNLLVVAFYRINIKNNWVTGLFSRRRT